MKTFDNMDGVFFAQKGEYNGGTYIFTHRDPKSGMLWGEDIPVKIPGEKKSPTEFGMWVAPESVRIHYKTDFDDIVLL